MKKVILSIALFMAVSAVTFAQETAGQKLDKSVEKTKQAGRDTKRAVKKGANKVGEEAKEAGQDVKMATKRTGKKMKRSVNKTAKKVEEKTEN
jgi:hypothetical protein